MSISWFASCYIIHVFFCLMNLIRNWKTNKKETVITPLSVPQLLGALCTAGPEEVLWLQIKLIFYFFVGWAQNSSNPPSHRCRKFFTLPAFLSKTCPVIIRAAEGPTVFWKNPNSTNWIRCWTEGRSKGCKHTRSQLSNGPLERSQGSWGFWLGVRERLRAEGDTGTGLWKVGGILIDDRINAPCHGFGTLRLLVQLIHRRKE